MAVTAWQWDLFLVWNKILVSCAQVYLQWNIALHGESGRKWFREGLELLEGNSINADVWERWSKAGKMEGPFNGICLRCNSFSSLTGLTPEELKCSLKKLKEMWESFLKQCCSSMAGPNGCFSLRNVFLTTLVHITDSYLEVVIIHLRALISPTTDSWKHFAGSKVCSLTRSWGVNVGSTMYHIIFYG